MVGGLAAYISQFNVTWKIFRKRLSNVRLYLLRIKSKGDLVDKVARYYDYNWNRQGGVMEQEVMNELPGPLRQSVAFFVSGDMIHDAPFLARCDETTKQLLISALQSRVFLPSDLIIQEGERGNELFFLERGRVSVSSSSTKDAPPRILSRGDFFGESCLLGSSSNNETVKALSYCETFTLTKEVSLMNPSAFYIMIWQFAQRTYLCFTLVSPLCAVGFQ